MNRHSVRRPLTATGALLIGALGLGGLASAADSPSGLAPRREPSAVGGG